MYLINEENGRFFGWTEQLSKKPGMRKATDDEVAAFLGNKSVVVEPNPEQTFDEAIEAFEEKQAIKKAIEEPLHIVEDKAEDEPDSTDSGSKKPARRRNSRRRG